jgi:DNA-directed RNA polymerase subunit RPC12/RpoP
MKCTRCSGRLILDRVFTDNKNFETACIHCGDRKYIDKGSETGLWLAKKEQRIERLSNGLS